MLHRSGLYMVYVDDMNAPFRNVIMRHPIAMYQLTGMAIQA
jgi:hypothetical protein